MLEMKVTITAATDLVAALNNLAAAFAENKKTPVSPAVNTDIYPTTGSLSATERTDVQVAPKSKSALSFEQAANPTSVQVAQPTAAPAIMPLTAEQTATPIAPTTPVAAPAPAVTPAANVTPAPAVPTSAPQYTLEVIATAGSALIDAGKMDQLMQLLNKFGVASITELSPANYGAMATALRALGAAI